ncbi:MAG: response regulator [Schwartzia sp.]|nr:response regulator [Schwartzia sp. (in: firmicutes)]MBR1760328.1 response regulator [Schwartzia sp. (in: firmicutes)]MBR1885181.1 response regulator [Schwartzia sp. (in: firmicutes)]
MAKILLVDDNEINLMMTEMVLSEMHYEVATATSGEAAIEMLRQEPFDLLLLDIVMEGMSGIETLARIREMPEISGIRVIFLTSSSHMADMTEAIRLGALEFIRKPALPENLYSAVRQALSVRKKDTILAVDDDEMNLFAIEKLFGIRYDVRCVSSGAEALAALRQEKPELVLLDLHMPDMDGMEVMQRIRDIEHCENLPVVFLTADSDADTEAKLFNAGAMDFLAKPLVMQVAMQRIRRILELKHLQDSLYEEVNRKTVAVQESNRKINNLSDQIIRALSGAIDAKDSYTNGHSSRVAEYSRELARRLGKPRAAAAEIYNIALLHDVGKIGIPGSILSKPGKLTDEEFAVIKSHTMKGYEILKTISEMPELSIGARWHHERYDGKGYPDGKAGEDIPEIARIICVADCYDAMSSDRIYRGALPQHIVREEIENNSGTQFDPRVAEVMLQMIDEDKDYKMRGSTVQ